MARKTEVAANPLTAASAFVDSVRADCLASLEHIKAYKITDASGDAWAETALNKVAKTHDEFDAKRKSWVGPLKAVVKDINATFKIVLDPLKEAEGVLKAKIGERRLLVERERVRLLREAAEAARAGDDEAAETAVIQASAVAVREEETSSTKIEWTGEVIDAAVIPRQYLVPDVATLKALTKAAGRDPGIPGWKAYELAVVKTSRR